MILYKKDDIVISTIEIEDKDSVLELYENNNFNCDFETGSLRPSSYELSKMIDNVILKEDLINNILVLKKNNLVIGYLGMFVEYDRLILGHIAVKEEEKNNGYGKLLTSFAIMIAENENRDVSLHCLYPNSYLSSLGFKTHDRIHYLYEKKGLKVEGIPIIFMSIEEYKKHKDEEMQKEIESYREFLQSDIMKKIL